MFCKIVALRSDLDHTLEFENMSLEVDPLGAKVLKFEIDGENILFYDPKDLKHSGIPICFPFFGPLSEPLNIQGKKYSLPQHGFLRDMTFQQVARADNSMTYVFRTNEATLKQFPFNFEFKITYTVEDETLQIKAEVKHLDNLVGSAKMPLALAFHPYFAVDNPDQIILGTNAQHYFDNNHKENKVDFIKKSEVKNSVELKGIPGLVGAVESAFNLYNVAGTPDLHFTDHTDSLSLLVPGSEKFILLNTDPNDADATDFKYLTLWRAKPDAKYICVEPSTAMKNSLVKEINRKEKADIIWLEKGQTKEFSISIEPFLA